MCERDRRARARLDAARRTNRDAATTAGGSPTSRRFERDYPDWSAALRRRGHAARDPRRERRALDAARVKLSVVIPAHNEAEVDRADAARADRHARAARGSTTRSSSSTTRSTRRHRRRRARAVGERSRACAACATRRRNGFGFAVRAGLEAFTRRRRGDRDGRRLGRPARRRPLLPRARGRLRLRVRLALHARRAGHDYPRLKLLMNRIVNLGIRAALPPRLQRHDQRVQGLPARGDRERPAAALAALQPDRRAAAEGGHARLHLRDRADLVDQPRGGRVEARSSTRWAAATCSSCSTCSSRTT